METHFNAPPGPGETERNVSQSSSPSPWNAGKEIDLAGLQEAVIQWIRENQTPALLGGFVLGVFIGAKMRS